MGEAKREKDIVELVNDFISTTDHAVLGGILVASLCVLVTIIFWVLRKGSAKRRSVLLVGLCDSGKTLIYSRLIHRKYLATQTSIVENAAEYNTFGDKKKALRLIDLPGHERVRQQFIDKFKGSARGLIFVVDSMTFQKDLKDVAELLYQLLTDRVIMKNSPSFLIACNKNDQTLAKGARYVQSALEKELNNVRKTQSAALDATDGASSATFIGRSDQNFTFADLRTLNVEFVECSAAGQNGGTDCQLDELKKWLGKLA